MRISACYIILFVANKVYGYKTYRPVYAYAENTQTKSTKDSRKSQLKSKVRCWEGQSTIP